MLNVKIRAIFNKTVDIVFGLILALIILGILIGAVQLLISTWSLLAFKGITGHYINFITDVLTLYVLIELSRSLIEYFSTHQLRLTFITDAAIVFIIREILITLFKHETSVEMLFALSALLLVLGALRISSILVYQKERKILSEQNT